MHSPRDASTGPAPRSRYREAILVFVVTVVVLLVIIAAVQVLPTGLSPKSPEIVSGDYIDYGFRGRIDNESAGGNIRVYFTERTDGQPNYYIVTLTPSGGTEQSAPFALKPLLVSQNFRFEGHNFYCVGDLLGEGLPRYADENASILPTGSYGTLVGSGNLVTAFYGNKAVDHYVKIGSGATLEQWVTTGEVRVPIKITYTDGSDTDVEFDLLSMKTDWDRSVRQS